MFSFLKKKKADDRELYRRIDKKPLKYVTERDLETYVESVIGKEGRINIYNDEIAIYCNGTEIFRCKLDGADIGELMSMEGAVLKGVDIKTGKTRSIVAYYKYYRKV